MPINYQPSVNGKLTEHIKPNEYYRIHQAIRRKNPAPKECSVCGKSPSTGKSGRSRIVWANTTGIYNESIENYKPMCNPCHVLFDIGPHTGFCKYGHDMRTDYYQRKCGTKACQVCRREVHARLRARRKLKKVRNP